MNEDPQDHTSNEIQKINIKQEDLSDEVIYFRDLPGNNSVCVSDHI